MDGHHVQTWVQELDFENYGLPNYENLLMLTEKLQMNYDDFGKLLEIQDTVHASKMLIEQNKLV